MRFRTALRLLTRWAPWHSTITIWLSRSAPLSLNPVSLVSPLCLCSHAIRGCPAASVPSTNGTISIDDAIAKAENALAGEYNKAPISLEYVAKRDGSVALTHVVQIQNQDTGAWFEAFVDAHSGEITQLINLVSTASVGDSMLDINTVGLTRCLHSTVPFLSRISRRRRGLRTLLTLRISLLPRMAGIPQAGRRTAPHSKSLAVFAIGEGL